MCAGQWGSMRPQESDIFWRDWPLAPSCLMKPTHTTMGQREILTALIGNPPETFNFTIVFDLEDPAQFERAYRIAISMPDCYRQDPYYLPTY